MLKVLLKKEMIQFWRNRFLPALMFAFPVIVMAVMPWVMQLDVKNERVTVIDQDHSPLSASIISHLKASSYFVYVEGYPDRNSAIEAMDNDILDVVITLPSDFERNLYNGIQPKTISVEANGVNATKGALGIQYSIQLISQTLSQSFSDMQMDMPTSILHIENRYNPTQNARSYMIPAMMILVILLICGFLPAINIVWEKETGTIEQINVMPISPFQFVIAKLIPYWVMAFVVFNICMLMGWWIFDLVPAGSVLTIWPAALLFIIVMSAFSVFIANISNTLQQMVFMMFFFLLNFMLLSGMLTPIDSMPVWVQYLSMLFPPRYFIHIMRAVYLKATTLPELWQQYLALVLMAALFCTLAVKTYKKQA